VSTENIATGTTITLHHEDGVWWSTASNDAGWTAVADTIDEITTLTAERQEQRRNEGRP
jgi:hypothetical protein